MPHTEMNLDLEVWPMEGYPLGRQVGRQLEEALRLARLPDSSNLPFGKGEVGHEIPRRVGAVEDL